MELLPDIHTQWSQHVTCCIQTSVKAANMQRASKIYPKVDKAQKKVVFFFLPFHDEKQKETWMMKNIVRFPRTISGRQQNEPASKMTSPFPLAVSLN